MLNVIVKGLLAHKLRLVMTALSIALGVAFVAGTFVLSDAMNSSFSSAYTHQYAGVDVDVRSGIAFADAESGNQRVPVPASVAETVRRVPGVAAVEGAVSGLATMVGRDGKVVGAGTLSTTGMSAPTVAGLAGGVVYRAGRAPRHGGEVAIDAASAGKAGYRVGDRVRILFVGAPGEFTVTGVVGFGSDERLGSTTTALFDLATAQHVLGKVGRYDEVKVKAAPGVSAALLRDRVRSVLPAGTEADTGRSVAAELTALVKKNLTFINVFLLVFAAIAVFVGSFIIWNTFSILITQRSRELALLRAIGASRRQVLRGVLAESLVVGLLASVIGLAMGVGIARGLVVLFRVSVHLELPTPGAHLSTGTVVSSFAVGTLVTLLASLAPARKATRVAPVEALREAVPGTYRASRRRAVWGVLVTAAGIACLVAGLAAGSGISFVGVGVLVTFLGITTLLPLLARVLARVLGAPLARLGMPGKLARDNAMRNPRRTASTAAALMVGLALVASVSVLAASLKTSIGSDIERTARAELVVQQVGGNGPGLSPQVARAARSATGVATVSETAAGRGKVDGTVTAVATVDPATLSTVLDVGVRSGRLADLGPDGVFVYDRTARAKGWHVGSTVPVEWPGTGDRSLHVVGTFSEKGALDADYMVSLASYDAAVADRTDQLVLIKTRPGSSLAAVQRGVISALQPFANAEVLTRQEFTSSIAGQVDAFLLFVTALLLLAVVIALLGIVNTLALSVFERTREIGLLRAVGMSRREVRSMVRYESVIISLIGAVSGAAVGVAFGIALVEAMGDQGVSHLTLPGTTLVLSVLCAAGAGVLASVWPACRAADVDVLRAVVTD